MTKTKIVSVVVINLDPTPICHSSAVVMKNIKYRPTPSKCSLWILGYYLHTYGVLNNVVKEKSRCWLRSKLVNYHKINVGLILWFIIDQSNWRQRATKSFYLWQPCVYWFNFKRCEPFSEQLKQNSICLIYKDIITKSHKYFKCYAL